MPDGTIQEHINDMNRLLHCIHTAAIKHPVRGRDIEVLERVKEIQAGPLFEIQKYVEQTHR